MLKKNNFKNIKINLNAVKNILLKINFKKIFDRIVKSYKSEGLRMTFITFTILFGIVYIIPIFFDNSRLKYDIETKLKNLTQATISIKGEVSVSLIPSPSISLSNVFIENYAPAKKRSENDDFYNIYVKNLKIIFPIFKFNNKQPIVKIIADKSIIEIARPDVLSKIDNSLFNTYLKNISNSQGQQSVANNTIPSSSPSELLINKEEKTLVDSLPKNQPKPSDGISSSIFSMADIESTAIFLNTPPSLQLNDTTITYFDENGVVKEFLDVNTTISYQDDLVDGYGSFVSQSIDNQFKIHANFDLDNANQSYLNISSGIYDLNISGNFLDKNVNGLTKTKFKGNLDLEIIDIKNFYKSLISSNDIVANKLKNNTGKIKINSILENNDQNTELKKIIITSSSGNGDGNISFSNSSDESIGDIKLKFDDLNIDNLWETDNPAKKINQNNDTKSIIDNAIKKSESNQDKNPQISNVDQKISFKSPLIKIRKRENSNEIIELRDYDINTEIIIKNATIYQGKIEEIKIMANASNKDKIFISPLYFKFAGNSEFNIVGILDRSISNSGFEGYIEAKGDSLADGLKWLGFKPTNFRFDSLQSYSLYSKIFTNQNILSLSNLFINLNDKKTEFYGDFEIKDYEKKRTVISNLKFSELDFKKYFSIQNNNIYLKQGILFDKLLWLNKVYSDYNLKFKFDKLIYEDEEFENLNIGIEMGQGYFKIPKTNFKSPNNDLTFELILDISDKKQIANMLIDGKTLKINFKEKLPNITTGKYENILDKFFELPSLQGFSGEISISLDKINLENTLINDFKYKNSYVNSIFDQANLSMKIFDGAFEFKGINDIKYNKIINGNFTCKSCNSNKMLDVFFNVKNIEGIANVSGNIVAIAKTFDEFKKNINSEISFAAIAPKINGYGLNDLVEKMFNFKEYPEDLMEPEKIINNSDLFTQYTNAKGSINFKNDKNYFSISFKSPAINSIFSGQIFPQDKIINGTLNTIFITGNKSKKIPLNITSTIAGPIEDVATVSNLNQVRQYLGLKRINNQQLTAQLLNESKEKLDQRKIKTNNNVSEVINQPNINFSDKILQNNPKQDSQNDNVPIQDTEAKDKTILLSQNNEKNEINKSSSTKNESENINIVQPSF